MEKEHSKKVTVQDIAALANVSVATVSRALSRPEKVSDKTRKIIMKAVKETGYTVNEAARSLRRQQTDTIVIMLPNIGNAVFSNVVEGIEDVCADNGISVLIADTQKASMSPTKARGYFSQNRVDGVIILDGLMPVDVINSGAQTPAIVFAGEWNPEANLPTVHIDDELGIRLAIKHLFELGHRKLGQVSGPRFNLPGKIRYDAFNQEQRHLWGNAKGSWSFEGDFSLASGAAAAHAWFALTEDKRPTGVVCAGDAMAFGFISALDKLGIKVPSDVSVVGFDDLQVAQYFVPALTTIHQPRRKLGVLAAKTLLALIKKQDASLPEPIEPWLVVRDSTAKPR